MNLGGTPREDRKKYLGHEQMIFFFFLGGGVAIHRRQQTRVREHDVNDRRMETT